MSLGVVSCVLNQLSALLVNEAKLLGGLGEEIQGIVDELGQMKAFLMFAEGREEEDPRLQEWIFQVQDVAYDIQDVVDEFMMYFGRIDRHGFLSEIQDHKCRNRYLFENGNSVQALGFDGSVSNSWNNYKDEAFLVAETKLVGINLPKQQLLSEVLDGDRNMKVVSVLGMGGIGKTTLVRKVQEDPDVKRQFEIIAWVTVSQSFDMTELLKDLIQQLYQNIQKPVPEQVASTIPTELLKMLVKEFLQEKKYLIVFDDVWHPNFWNVIKLVMPEGGCGNRVMLTTRIEDAALASSVEFNSYLHQMQPLCPDDSWLLFCKKTFKGDSLLILKILLKGYWKAVRGCHLQLSQLVVDCCL